jgi:hypothetical protein
MLLSFDPHLDSMTDSEVVDIIVYLDYYLTKEPQAEVDSAMNLPGSL